MNFVFEGSLKVNRGHAISLNPDSIKYKYHQIPLLTVEKCSLQDHPGNKLATVLSYKVSFKENSCMMVRNNSHVRQHTAHITSL